MEPLSLETTRRVAHLARLALSDADLERMRVELGAILGYVEALRELDLEGVEPLVHVGDIANRCDEDTVRAPMATEALMRMAPASDPPFLRVPKVIGGESS